MPGFSSGTESTMYADNVDFSGSATPTASVTADGELLIGSTASPNIRVGSLGSSDSSITWTVGAGTITGQVTSGTTVGKTITGDTGGALSPTSGNWNIVGSGSTTTSGTGSTLTVQMTGLTQYSTLVGAGSATITKIAPSATVGIPYISQGVSANPTFGTAVVAGGGTGLATLTAYAPIVGGTTSTAALQQTASGSASQILQSAGSAAIPTWSTATYPATTTANQILYSSATNTVSGITGANNGVLITSNTGVPSLLPNGTVDYVLTANTSAPPSWKVAGGGTAALTLLSTQTASTTATLDFTGIGIGSTYFFILILIRNLQGVTDGATLRCQMTRDGGSTWETSGYEAGINTQPYNSGTITNTNSTTNFVLSGPIDNSGASRLYSANIQLTGTSSRDPTIHGTCTFINNTGGVSTMGVMCGRGPATSVNGLRFLMSTNDILVGTISLYGYTE